MVLYVLLKVCSVADGQVEANLLQVTFSALLNYLVQSSHSLCRVGGESGNETMAILVSIINGVVSWII